MVRLSGPAVPLMAVSDWILWMFCRLLSADAGIDVAHGHPEAPACVTMSVVALQIAVSIPARPAAAGSNLLIQTWRAGAAGLRTWAVNFTARTETCI